MQLKREEAKINARRAKESAEQPLLAVARQQAPPHPELRKCYQTYPQQLFKAGRFEQSVRLLGTLSLLFHSSGETYMF